ncbi:hypothetical protein TVAG_278260 [Trichomonas vaginalis G3]|uniref:Uncharacterized protein n=1 Tax=Trichomonas vaginalis (strain ATCC PRA-98 / G3) TaxID=412133 RepID=A2DU67_TRIV3|nr:hypothetical protein TVAGG3_0438410 [Trichomonas vaginalis G3]EAY16060.1 hypothetical protein TVAG_278260 [Trichomonas vaginalis G3]KAI5537274.1 hypothetical protein TVAGG3_0438410 [Trichomonas vaginalis G3]|eukprot:XP_001328283.1 hypothetical protein [Trichomonas vaginalis G3]
MKTKLLSYFEAHLTSLIIKIFILSSEKSEKKVIKMFCFSFLLALVRSEISSIPINNFYGSIYCSNTTIKDLEFKPTLSNKNQPFGQDISKIPLTRLEYTNDTLRDYDPVNENFDYLNLNFSDTVVFNPVEMRNIEIDTYSPTNYTIHIENVLEKESIKISRVFTNCPFIFIEKTKSSTIKPS